jgi:hypothetical protein
MDNLIVVLLIAAVLALGVIKREQLLRPLARWEALLLVLVVLFPPTGLAALPLGWRVAAGVALVGAVWLKPSFWLWLAAVVLLRQMLPWSPW